VVSRNPFVFVVGCPRSGTTLLRRMLDAHPDLAITRETHWIPELWKRRVGLTADGLVTAGLVDALVADSRFADLSLERRDLDSIVQANGRLSYASFITALFDLYGSRQGKPLVGDKTPGYAREIATLYGLWPRARFVHLIRDGRDVCLSALKWRRKAESFARRFGTWSEDPVTTAALWWEWHVRAARLAGHSLAPTLYREVRYESLVDDPETEASRLCEFLAIGHDAAILRFHEGRTRTEPGLSPKRAWLPPTPGLRDWRRELARPDLVQIEATIGDLLEELGYERGVDRLPAAAVTRAGRIRRAFERALPDAHQALPEGW
jgi:hypothetical protein